MVSHSVSINTPGYPTLRWVMSKFLALGLFVEDVVAKATIEPAKIIGRVPGLGTLQIGAPADVTILDRTGLWSSWTRGTTAWASRRPGDWRKRWQTSSTV